MTLLKQPLQNNTRSKELALMQTILNTLFYSRETEVLRVQLMYCSTSIRAVRGTRVFLSDFFTPAPKTFQFTILCPFMGGFQQGGTDMCKTLFMPNQAIQ